MAPDRDPSGSTPLGTFLRARREQITPQQVGLPDHGRRRVPGLRREELAMLAGVSVDYYVRLEQGRNDHPSPQVLDALARVLKLGDDETRYLRDLAEPPPRRRTTTPRKAEVVSPVLQQLLHGLPNQPAFVLGRYMDVLAVNPIMEALVPSHAVGHNIVRAVFLDPASRDCYPEWGTVADDTVGSLRASVGADTDDPYLQQLVGELSIASDEFRQRWARHHVRPKTGGVKQLRHPLIGELELPYETLSINSAPGQLLVIYVPAVGSKAEDAIALLAGLVEPAESRAS